MNVSTLNLRVRSCRPARTALLGLAIGLVVAGGGCRHADLADQRFELRCQRLGRTANVAVESERGRLAALSRTASAVRESEHRHAAASRDNLDELQAYWMRDWERWIERQPLYRDGAWRILGGHPDRIERNAIILFF